MLLRKRKREDADVKRDRSVKPEDDGDDEERRKRRKTGDVAVVVEHCERASCMSALLFLTARR